MTLLVGILCQDGVVMGADSTATLGTGVNDHTARQLCTKLDIISQTVVVGTSGPVGLGQRYVAEVEELYKVASREAEKHPILAPLGGVRLGRLKPHRAMTAIRQAIAMHLTLESQIAGQLARAIQNDAINGTMCAMLVAMPIDTGEHAATKKVHLFQFDRYGAPEEATEKLPLVALGSGQRAADPFLSYLRSILWKDRVPTVAEARFVAQWTLQYVIDTDPGGVGGPIQLITVQPKADGTGTVATSDDTEAGEEAIAAIKQQIADFVGSIREDKSGAPEAPPVPPPGSATPTS
jgi:20S proteasome alpha/beta subunit